MGVRGAASRGVAMRRLYRAGKVSTDCLGSGEKRGRPGTEDGRYLVMCFSLRLSSPPFSSVLHNPKGIVVDGGQHTIGVLSLNLNFPSSLPLQLISVMW